MACGEVQDVEVTTTSWCWTWHGPWRCSTTTLERRHVYDFAILRKRYRWLSVTYRACCEIGGGEFTWSETAYRFYWNPPDEYNVQKKFENALVSTGPCSLGPGVILRDT
jgi:hypothetical protein